MHTHNPGGKPSRARFAIPLAAGALLLALAAPSPAAAAQTLTVEKNGTDAGTVISSPAGIECGASCEASFADGATVALAGIPDESAGPVKWAGCDSVTLENKCKVTMSEAKTVKVTFDLAKRKLSVSKGGTGTGMVKSSPAGIDCGNECSAEYDHGAEVTLTGTSGANTEAVKWSGCGSVDVENHCKVTMSAAHSVAATFNLNQIELKVTKKGTGTGTVKSTPAGIDCGAKCAAKFGEGSTVTLTGTPGASTEPTVWSGCTSVDAEGKCLVTMSAAKEVTATFNHPQFPLSVTKVGPGNGTVTSTLAGVECGNTCSAGFDQGSTVTLASVSGINSEAVQWSGCDTITGENKCEVAMSAAKAIVATYKAQAGVPVYVVSVEKKGTGQGTVTSSPVGIQCGTSCSTEVVSKAKVTLIATPAEGSVFSHWSGGSCAGSGPCERTINSTRTVHAVFTAIGTRRLTLNLAGSGAGAVKSKKAGIECSASCSPSLAAGTALTLTAAPAAGSTFAGFSGACSGAKTCKVTMSEALTVTATFAKAPAPAPGMLSVAAKAKVRGGKAYVRIGCAAGASSCRGSLKLTAKVKGKGKSVTIGAATFALAPGSSTTLKIKLSAKARQALKSKGQLKARIVGTGIKAGVVRLKA